ncbi:MAG: hypothetical protein WBM14_08785 [Terracidiphilus sp.]|jgi:hypothetical protein
MRVYLEIPEDASPAHRARVSYAFRLFCAIYGHLPIMERADAANWDVAVRYRSSSFKAQVADRRTVWLSRGYRARNPQEPAPPPLKYACDGVETMLHYNLSGDYAPDWLGEIFEWVSCADEYSVTECDEVGRPLFAATYEGRYGLDIKVPYAGIAMRCLQQEICRVVPRASEEPESPCGTAHLVVPTHDVDYFPIGRLHAVNRLFRNAVISFLLLNRPSLGLRQAKTAARIAMGYHSDPLDRIAMLTEEEQRRGIGASYNFLVQHGHRLDAHYTLDNAGVVETMRWLEARGMEVGIHPSYLCLDDPRGLVRELSRLHARGFDPRGGRQHWLRYTMARLISSVERAALAYDTSIGWSVRNGFRAGACFAFPPYNFEQERAATFLEIPMVMMDQALEKQPDGAERMFEEAAGLLAASRRLGWGGISLLWHPAAFGEGWLPSEVGDLFWKLADRRAEWGDEWIRPMDFMEIARQRYVEVGLLAPEEPLPADEGLAEEWIEAAVSAKADRLHDRRVEPPEGFVGT